MQVTWYGLVLIVGSAICYSVFDLLRKRLMERTAATPLLVVLAAGQVPVLAAWAAASQDWRLSGAYWLPGLGSALLNILANMAFLEALRLSPLSVTVPVLSLTPVFTTWIAIPVLDQVPGPLRWLGIVLVVLGVLGLQFETEDLRAPQRLVQRFARERGSVLMVGVAVCWSLAMPLDRLALDRASTPVHAMILNGAVALGAALWLLVRGRLHEIRGALSPPGVVVAALVVATAAIGLQLLAILEIWVGLAETLKRALGSLLALALGWRYFAERISGWQIAAVVVMTAGVALILL